MDKLVLIDGHSILNRAFYGVPELTNSKGIHTNAVYGFINIMLKVIEDEKATHIAVAFDLKDPTFRHKMYDGYKGTRKPMPEELHEQVPIIKEVLAAMGIPILTKSGYEADDILGTVAKRQQADGIDVTILSGDRDLLQLSDEHIKISIPKTSKGQTEIHNYYPEDVKAEYQVTPIEFIDLKALMGDTSDNIPGVPSIGEKTATAIITAYGSIENAYAHVDELKPPRAQKAMREHYDMAQMSKTLATICIEAPVEFRFDDSLIENFYTKEAYELLKNLEIKSLLKKFDVADEVKVDLANTFSVCNDFSEAEDIFAKLGKEKALGVSMLTEGDEILACAYANAKDETIIIPAEGFLTGSYLAAKTEDLFKTVEKISVLSLKPLLPLLKNTDRAVVDGFYNQDGRRVIFDAGVAAYLLNPLKDTYAYDDIARDYLGMTIPSKEDLIGKAAIGAQMQDSREKVLNICGYMAVVSIKAREIIEKKLSEEGMEQLFYDVEMPVIYSLYHMEEEGVVVKREELVKYGEKLGESIAQYEKEIYEAIGHEFNINSPKQLGVILFEEMGIKGGKKTKSGYSTSAEVLQKLAPDYPFVKKILDYRQVTKLKSTYADGLGDYIAEDGRIHGKFNQTITATGRISSSDPNLQNIPVRMELGREIRRLFVPKDGYVFVDADYSQIELRVLAHMSGDENLIQAYKHAADIHAITASQVFHVPLEEVTPRLRSNAKAVNFGIVYGISAFGLSEDLSISRKEANEYIARYFETYPGVKAFLDKQVADAKETGNVRTLFGRIRPVPELKSSNFMQRSFGERVAMNSPVQGTAADIIKIAMIRVDERLRREGLKSRLVLQIHDELLIETAADELETVTKILEEEMKHAADLSVELSIEVKNGNSWYETK